MCGVDRPSSGRYLCVALSERPAGLTTLRTRCAGLVTSQLGGLRSGSAKVDHCRDARSSPFLLLEGHPILMEEGYPFSQLLGTSFARQTGLIRASNLTRGRSPRPIIASIVLGRQGKRRIPPIPKATPSHPSGAVGLLRQVLRMSQRP